MQIKCINPKEYNLTEGKDYTVVSETSDRYVIVNDKSLGGNYAKNLFENIPEVPAIPELKVTYYTDRVNINGTNISYFEMNDETNISCGIREVWGLINFMQTLEARIIEIDESYLSQLSEIYANSVQSFLNGLEESEETAIIITSTNTNCTDYDIIKSGMEGHDFTVTSVLGKNPNTGNEIILWTIIIRN